MFKSREIGIIARRMFISALVGTVLAGCSSSSNDTVGTNLVSTDKGTVKGTETASLLQYLGIPYASPPIGALRWQPPQAAKPWTDIRPAASFASNCAQPATPFGKASTSEDCLYLNVFTPKTGGPFPVMVWIHGGALYAGESDAYDPTQLVQQGVAVVTINYRLGALGFLTHPALTAESPDGISGNYGLMDQQAALKWVKTNIAAFGGNPANVTIFGESAGGLSTHAQIVSPLAAGLFQKAIVQSGGYSLDQPSLAAAQTLGQNFATAAGCTDQSAACLRNLPIASLLTFANRIQVGGTTLPTVDGKVLPQTIRTAFNSGNFNKVSVIEGSNANEYSLLSAATIDPLLGHPISSTAEYSQFRDPFAQAFGKSPAQVDAQYPQGNFATLAEAYDTVATDAGFSCNGRTAAKSLSAAVPVFAYEFNDPNAPMNFKLPPRPRFGAYHAAEIQYIFPGNIPIYVGAPFTAAQQALSGQMIGFWAQFAKTGNPNATGSTLWPQYTTANDTYLSLQPGGATPTTQFAANHKCAFWTGS